MSIEKRKQAARQAGLCARMMENVEARIIRKNAIEAMNPALEGCDMAGYEYGRNEGLSRTQLKADIKHLRRELLALSNMIDG